MDETSFLTLVYPAMFRSRDGVIIRFFIWCEWLYDVPEGVGQAFVLQQAFLEPQRPYSIMPHGLARQGVRLNPILHDEAGAPPQAATLGLTNAEPRTAVMRFAQHHTTPDCSDESRTCCVIVWCQGVGATPAWQHPVLGADFFLEHRLELFVDYGRLRYALAGLGQIRFDSLVACGYLGNPGDFDAPDDGGDDPDPFAGFPVGPRSPVGSRP